MVTDGPFDMGRFLYLQTRHIRMPFPYNYASTWANLRKCFANFYKGDFYKGSSGNNSTNRLPGLQTMLDMLGKLQFLKLSIKRNISYQISEMFLVV